MQSQDTLLGRIGRRHCTLQKVPRFGRFHHQLRRSEGAAAAHLPRGRALPLQLFLTGLQPETLAIASPDRPQPTATQVIARPRQYPELHQPAARRQRQYISRHVRVCPRFQPLTVNQL